MNKEKIKEHLIWNTWKQTLNMIDIEGYIIRFGNTEMGYQYTKEEFTPFIWKFHVNQSKGQHPGDIDLLYNGNVIRAVWNAEHKLTDKDIQYPCKYKKFKYDENVLASIINVENK